MAFKKTYFFFFLLLLYANICQAQISKKRVVTLMGSRFDITVVATSDSLANFYIDTVVYEITRIEDVISEWRSNTMVSEVNRNAGIRPVKVSQELFDLTKHALYFSQITDGAFDISIAAMDKIWRFDGTMDSMPSQDAIKRSILKIGYKHIVLNDVDTTIFLQLKGMKIGFGSIGKGYAADKGKQLLQSLKVKGGIVNASGDMSVWGAQPNGKSWVIGITNPFKPESLLQTITLKNSSVVTSGSYEKYVRFNGKRYSHIINPATGYPATGLISVTVKGPSAEMANGISTSIMVIGKEKGRKLLQKFAQYKVLIITDNGKRIRLNGFK